MTGWSFSPVIIASAAHRDLVVSAMEECGIAPSAIILEPKGRNTAATAALAALIALEIDPEAHVLLATSGSPCLPCGCFHRDNPRCLRRVARPDRHLRNRPDRA